MSFLLIGNGFDLHHFFPTSYINFLHTTKFLINQYDASMNTVGHILGNSALWEEDLFLKLCYERHSIIYDATILPEDRVKRMLEKVERNMWFNYFSNAINRDIRWIDFEKEISRVLKAFSNFIVNTANNKLSLRKC